MVLLAGTLELVGRRLSGLRRSAARVITTAGVLAGPLLVGASVMALGGEAGEGARAAGATQAAACPAEALVAALNDPARLGERSRIVLAHVDLGPMLLYRTSHSVVATPYHRNAAGILDTRRIMQSEDPEAARRMMAERGVDVVIPCGFLAPPATPSPSRSPTFATLLQRGREPDWLIRHSLADGAGASAIYEVRKGEG